MPGVVLGVEPFGSGSVEDRAEAADLGAGDAGAVVDDQAGDDLRRVRAEDAGLGLVDGETLARRDRADMMQQRADLRVESGTARERQVVGVPGVGGAEPGGQAGQPAVEPRGDLVRQRGAGAGTLREPADRWRRAASPPPG